MIRKGVIYSVIFVIICLCLPVIITRIDKTVVNTNIVPTEANKQEETYNYNSYNTIKLLHKSTGEIEEVYLDEYLYGVVAAEMPASYEKEALKAQAAVARTYTIYNIKNIHKHENCDMCDDSSCCQAYITKQDRFEKWDEKERETNWERIVGAVNSTAGKIITYNGEPINALFHANSGGETEISSNVWGGADYPYLQTVATSGEEGYKQYSSSVTITKEEVADKLKQNHPDIIINYDDKPIEILEYTDSGRVKTIRFGNTQISGVEARSLFGLKSTKFNVTIGENVTFDVIGYGHGVGMSQTGADSLAKESYSYEEIIKHFYPGVEIKNL